MMNFLSYDPKNSPILSQSVRSSPPVASRIAFRKTQTHRSIDTMPQADGSAVSEVTDECFQNQRFWPAIRWSSSLLPTDRYALLPNHCSPCHGVLTPLPFAQSSLMNKGIPGQLPTGNERKRAILHSLQVPNGLEHNPLHSISKTRNKINKLQVGTGK